MRRSFDLGSGPEEPNDSRHNRRLDNPADKHQVTPAELCGHKSTDQAGAGVDNPERKFAGAEFVTRHGRDVNDTLTDESRAKVREEAGIFAARMTRDGTSVEIATSPARRAVETADIFSDALGGAAVHLVDQLGLDALDDEDLTIPQIKTAVRQQLGEEVTDKAVLMVTHEPQAEEMVGSHSRGGVPYGRVMLVPSVDDRSHGRAAQAADSWRE